VIYNMLYGTSITSYAGTAHLMIGDTVTLSNGSSFAGTKYWGGASWLSPGVVIDGNLLVSGTVSASALNVSTLSAITANLGTVTAGTISAAADIDISGGAKVSGNKTSVNYVGYQASGVFNDSLSSDIGVIGLTNRSEKAGVAGYSLHVDAPGLYGGNLDPTNGLGARVDGKFRWGSYTWASPPGGSSLLASDGTWLAQSTFAIAGHDHAAWYAAIGHAHAGVYADSGHNHAGVYLGVSEQATDSAQLGGYSPANWLRQTGATAGTVTPNYYLTVTGGGITVRIPCAYP
jgi:hypothetical protein